MKFKKMAAVVLAGVTACATVPAAVPVFAADGYDHEAIENAGDITLTMMIAGVASDNDFETEQLPKLVKEKWPNVTLEVTKLPCYVLTSFSYVLLRLIGKHDRIRTAPIPPLL